MTHFTPWLSLGGGLLIGLASIGLLMLAGRIAGISGIAAGLLRPRTGEVLWRGLFVLGLLLAGWLGAWLRPDLLAFEVSRSHAALIAAGLLVGFGTQLGSGCTSGHGICGLGRFSKRSLVAVLAFMASAAATVTVIHFGFGGTL